MQVERGNMGKKCEEQAAVQKNQEHAVTEAASFSYTGKSEP